MIFFKSLLINNRLDLHTVTKEIYTFLKIRFACKIDNCKFEINNVCVIRSCENSQVVSKYLRILPLYLSDCKVYAPDYRSRNFLSYISRYCIARSDVKIWRTLQPISCYRP